MSNQNLFFFNDTATTEIYTLSLHDALPISRSSRDNGRRSGVHASASSASSLRTRCSCAGSSSEDRKSTRLNSSHVEISYAVFCLKKKIETAPRHFAPTFNPREFDLSILWPF